MFVCVCVCVFVCVYVGGGGGLFATILAYLPSRTSPNVLAEMGRGVGGGGRGTSKSSPCLQCALTSH